MDAVDLAAGEPLAFREQIALSNAISWVDSLLIHEANNGPSVADKLGAALVVQSLAPVLTIAWPDRPDVVEDLDAFVAQARARLLAYLREQEGGASFVPAVGWDHGGRVHLLEHMRADVEQIVGGHRAWDFIEALAVLAGGESVRQLAQAGLDIKIRAVTSFLLGGAPSKRYEANELTAAQFFAAGEWGKIRSPRATTELQAYSDSVSKLVAHLTAERPRVEDLDRYNGDRQWPVLLLLHLLGEFGAAVDAELVPGWLPGWASTVGRDMYHPTYFTNLAA
jgi:hypothetical protein